MKIGLMLALGEDDGLGRTLTWPELRDMALAAEVSGLDSIFAADHLIFHDDGQTQGIRECWTILSAIAALTSRVEIGPLVLAVPFRNPALTAKMAGTLDVISGGRYELGIGAGWKRDEWNAYGYGFPETRERLAILRDGLEVITRMLAGGRADHATFEGEHASVRNAINLPKGLQSPRIPIMVGGNGPEVTWRLAARFADELNLDGMSPDELREALPVIRSRCEELDRDPESLRISVHAWWGNPDWASPGDRRIAFLGQLGDLGIDRVMGLLQESASSDEALTALAEDARAAGVRLA